MRSAAVGGILWCVLAARGLAGAAPLGIIERLYLLAPLVLVPLALDLVADRGRLGVARALVPWCASAAAASFLVRRGLSAAALAALWLAFTGLLAWDGLDRLRSGAWRDAGQAAIAAGLAFLPIGGCWLLLSRLGVAPLGFEEPIVLLTAVHFHYAAFVDPGPTLL